MFFLLAALTMMERYKWIVFPIGITAIELSILIIAAFDQQYNLLARMAFTIYSILFSIPIVVLYFYMYMKTNSGKALGYSLGMLLLTIGQTLINFSPSLGVLYL
ncbi:MAG: hypothetical protein ACFFBD_07135 [Candidatus Hodarchaeota archaeon]